MISTQKDCGGEIIVPGPYMRALFFLGMEYLNTDERKDIEEILLDLIDMNPTDNQGVRDILMEHAIERHNWSIVRHLFKAFPDEYGLVFKYSRFIYLYMTLGRKSKTKRALLDAFDRNPYPLMFLIGTAQVPDDYEFYKVGSPEEGMQVLHLFGNFLEKNNKAIPWVMRVLADHNRNLEEVADTDPFPPIIEN